MKLCPEYLNQVLQPYPHTGQIYIAYSGGIDSHVLLHLCAQSPLFSGQLTAVHVHHGLQAQADAWARHCKQVARELQIGFILLRVDASPPAGASPEAAARDARYQALAKLLNKDDLLLTAQHQEDQYETFLLQLFRGAGLSGLAAMPEQMPLAKGLLVRPLLAVPKQWISDYAQQQQLRWVEDGSNQSDDFDRNYLRNQISPLIKARWPSVDKTVSRSARHCAEAKRYFEQSIEPLFITLYDSDQRRLNITQLLRQEAYCQQWLIRRWFQALDLAMPSAHFIQQVVTEVVKARRDAQPRLTYKNGVVCRYRDHLYWQVDVAEIDRCNSFIWPKQQAEIALPGNGKLTRLQTTNSGIAESAWLQAEIRIGYRQGGERIRLPGRAGHHRLKKLFQETGIPPWQRLTMPLVFLDGQLAAVADLWLSADFLQPVGGDNIQLQWLRYEL